MCVCRHSCGTWAWDASYSIIDQRIPQKERENAQRTGRSCRAYGQVGGGTTSFIQLLSCIKLGLMFNSVSCETTVSCLTIELVSCLQDLSSLSRSSTGNTRTWYSVHEVAILWTICFEDIVISIFAISIRNNFTVNKGLSSDFWIAKINTSNGMSLQHISEFVDLWTRINEVHLVEGTAYGIIWKFTISGEYTIWRDDKIVHAGAGLKELNSPKMQFAWLILQDRVWTDLLQMREWHNCGCCKLCN